VAARRNIPLKPVHLQDEDHVRAIWERNIVLVRPDRHVAWRNRHVLRTEKDVEDIIVGNKSFPGWVPEEERHGLFKTIIKGNPLGDPKFLSRRTLIEMYADGEVAS
jgi:FAD-dependent monooxygenase